MVAYLILSILFNTLFAACYKIAALKNCRLESVNLWLYVGAVATLLVITALKHHLAFNAQALRLGIISGIVLYFATLSFFHHMKFGQLSASWTVISLSVAFPVLASIFIWHETPSPKQIVGMALIMVALVLFGHHESKTEVSR